MLELSYWEHLSSRELGEVLDIPAPTVRSRLRRARELLETELNNVSAADHVRQSVMTNLDAWADAVKRSMTDPET